MTGRREDPAGDTLFSGHGPLLCPRAKCRHLLRHDYRKRLGGSELVANHVSTGVQMLRVCGIECSDDGLLDFSAREALACARQSLQHGLVEWDAALVCMDP